MKRIVLLATLLAAAVGVCPAQEIRGVPWTTADEINYRLLRSDTISAAFSALTASTNSNPGTFTATGNTWDFTGTTLFKLRVAAGLTTSVNGDIGYDTTNSNWHVWTGADSLLAEITGTPANNDCAKFTNTAGNIAITSNGGACGSGGSVPTGTGFTHITAGVQDGASKLVDVSSADITGILKAAAFPALTGPVTTTAGGLATTIGAAQVTNAMLATPPLTKAAVASFWIRSYDAATGLFTTSQPAFSDISGTGTCAQEPALTGDITSSSGSCATTFAASIGGAHTFTGNITATAGSNTIGAGQINGVCIVDGVQNATLAAAVTCAGSSGVIEIPMFSVPTLVASVTIPVGVTLRFDGPSGITTTGFTLTINGPLVAPPVQIFFGTGTLVIAPLQPLNALWFPGADIVAQIGKAYASSSASNTILVPPNPAGGPWVATTTTTFATAGKYALIQGTVPPSWNGTTAAGSAINYTPTTATTVFTIDWTPLLGGSFMSGAGIRDLLLTNGTTYTSGGSGSSATGVACGTTNGGAHHAFFMNLNLAGFGTGFTCNNGVAWGTTFIQSEFKFNNTGMSIPSANEVVDIVGGSFTENGTGISANTTSMKLTNVHMDSNTVVAITYTNSPGAPTLVLTGVHFENMSGNPCLTTTHYITGNPNVTMYGGEVSDDCTTGTNDFFFSTGGNSFDAFGVEVTTSGRVCTGTCAILVAGGNQSGYLEFNLNTGGLDMAHVCSGGPCAFFSNFSHIQSSGGTVGTVPTISANGKAVQAPLGTFRVSADFTDASSSALQTITGLSFVLPASTAYAYSVECHLAYSQATALVVDTFGIQAASLAPTNIFATGQVQITAGPPATFASGIMNTLTTTTATSIVSFTPGVLATVYKADLYAMVENPSGVANTINIMVSQATAGDLITVKRGSYCRVN